MIPQAFIDSLLQRVDVVEVVGAYVQLKKTGANYSGLCPFHTEKSPSFSVSPSKQFYHCFGCGAHGTAIGFLMEHLGLSFPQAVEDLAGRVGLEVPQEQQDGRSEHDRAESRDQRARLLAQLGEAAQFYKRRLRESPEAIAYLKRRGLTGEVAAQFMLGYSPAGWQSLQGVFADYAKPDLVDAGLVIQSNEGGLTKRYDRFRDRLMFPIRDERGEVIGFGARTLGQDEPKYLNSPETPVFSKGHNLYGLFEAKQAIRAAQTCWVVEGYMDVVALHQHGIGHVVATLGTATTPDHLRLLMRRSSRLVFMFDGDAAGRRAAAKALEVSLPVLQERLSLQFAFLPPEHDPDSYVRAHGAEALREFVRASASLSSFLLDRAAAGQNLKLPEGRAAATTEAKRLLALMPDGELRRQIAREAVERFQTSAEGLGVRLGRTPGPRSAGTASVAKGMRGLPSLADRLCRLVVRRPDWAQQVRPELLEQLPEGHRRLVRWSAGLSRQGVTAAGLYERVQAMGEEAGEDRALFLRCWAPDLAADALMEADAEAQRSEWQRVLSSLQLRSLESQAAALATLTTEQDRARLRSVRMEIAQIKEMLSSSS
jgi:DNA primase